jgi:hypothetical protein
MRTTAGQRKGVPEYRYQKYRSIIAKPSFTKKMELTESNRDLIEDKLMKGLKI